MKTLKRLKLKNLLSFGNPGGDLVLRSLEVDIRKIPKHQNIEIIDKFKLNQTCEAIFRSIGESYKDNKRINGFGVLKFVNPELVAPKSMEAKRFFEFLKTRTSQLEK